MNVLSSISHLNYPAVVTSNSKERMEWDLYLSPFLSTFQQLLIYFWKSLIFSVFSSFRGVIIFLEQSSYSKRDEPLEDKESRGQKPFTAGDLFEQSLNTFMPTENFPIFEQG